MPRRFMLQVLNHDSRKDYQFRFESREDAVVGEVEAIGYVSRDPGYVVGFSRGDCWGNE